MKRRLSPYRPGIYDLLSPVAIIFIGVSWVAVFFLNTYRYSRKKVAWIKDRL